MKAKVLVSRNILSGLNGYAINKVEVRHIKSESCGSMANVKFIDDFTNCSFDFDISIGDWVKLSRDVCSALAEEESS